MAVDGNCSWEEKRLLWVSAMLTLWCCEVHIPRAGQEQVRSHTLGIPCVASCSWVTWAWRTQVGRGRDAGDRSMGEAPWQSLWSQLPLCSAGETPDDTQRTLPPSIFCRGLPLDDPKQQPQDRTAVDTATGVHLLGKAGQTALGLQQPTGASQYSSELNHTMLPLCGLSFPSQDSKFVSFIHYLSLLLSPA